MDEFGSEDVRDEEPAAFRDGKRSAWSDWSRDEWAFRIVTAVAVVEAVILIAAWISLSGVFGPGTGTIVVDSEPAAAEVRLDGTIAGITPLTVTAAEGRRSVEVRHQQTARTLTLDVVRGQTTHSHLEFVTATPPSPQASEIRITSEPMGAPVSIDGVPRGLTPLVVSTLSPGVHAVAVRGRNGQVNRTLDVTAGRAQSLHVLLPAQTAGPGWIDVTTTAPLRVFENGRFVGASGGGPIPLPPGSRDLEFVNEDLGVRVRQNAVIRSGATTPIAPALPRGRLAINAQPWAEVWLNGERVGETPLGNLLRPVGVYDVILRHPQLGERRTRVRVTGAGAARLNVDMQQRSNAP